MTTNKKKRLSMLDSLATAGTPAPTTSMISTNRALRAARDAVDGHNVWNLDPASIDDMRIADRLDPEDVAELRDSIDANGQTVPILVRRNPDDPDRFLLVYGRRRLEAIRSSDSVSTVRALVATLDEDAATRAQISENMGRRDLSYIEKALFARELIEQGYGNQSQVADVLTVSKSSISMALSIVEMVSPALAVAIGPAHGVGRPRWEALGRAITGSGTEPSNLVAVAESAFAEAVVAQSVLDDPDTLDPTVAAFDAVQAALPHPDASPTKPRASKASTTTRSVALDGREIARVRRAGRRLRMDIDGGAFADWLDARAEDVIQELHSRWTLEEEK